MEKYPHQNHRSRVRKAFIDTDKSLISDIKLLEFILFYAIPRKDTRPIAENLLSKYGSLNNLCSVPYDELKNQIGLGESSAVLLNILPEYSKRISENKITNSPTNEAEIENKLFDHFLNEKNEKFILLCFNALDCLCGEFVLAYGNESSVTVEKRQFIKLALQCDSDRVIIAHNHPNNVSAPSKQDIELTADLIALLNQVDITLLDHIIFGNDGKINLKSTAVGKKLFQID